MTVICTLVDLGAVGNLPVICIPAKAVNTGHHTNRASIALGGATDVAMGTNSSNTVTGECNERLRPSNYYSGRPNMLTKHISSLILAASTLILAPSAADAICSGCTPSDQMERCSATCRSGGYTISVQKDNATGTYYLDVQGSDKYEFGDFGRANTLCGTSPGSGGCPTNAVITKMKDNATVNDNFCRVDGVA